MNQSGTFLEDLGIIEVDRLDEEGETPVNPVHEHQGLGWNVSRRSLLRATAIAASAAFVLHFFPPLPGFKRVLPSVPVALAGNGCESCDCRRLNRIECSCGLCCGPIKYNSRKVYYYYGQGPELECCYTYCGYMNAYYTCNRWFWQC